MLKYGDAVYEDGSFSQDQALSWIITARMCLQGRADLTHALQLQSGRIMLTVMRSDMRLVAEGDWMWKMPQLSSRSLI